MARTSNIALRLLASLKAEAERVAEEEGTSLNQFINIAVAEKLAALRTAQYFQERAACADAVALERILTRSGNEPPRPGDEIPADYDPEEVRRRLMQRKSRSG
jgi:hypothetical protein